MGNHRLKNPESRIKASAETTGINDLIDNLQNGYENVIETCCDAQS